MRRRPGRPGRPPSSTPSRTRPRSRGKGRSAWRSSTTSRTSGRNSHRIDRPRTIADGIGIGIILPPMAEILGRILDGALLVTDAEIRVAMRRLAFEAKIVAEPAGAAAFAAWTRYRETLTPPVVALVSGGNVDPGLFGEVTKG
ncbi:MAG: pyridoxal-phosphate dependent enzyme [Methanobacteriota archaeon]|nr:MAG: pyridoxal-phosphate dependent enzyme [Euryarchaeota archaeon]